MLPHLETLAVPPDVEDAAAEAFGDDAALLEALGANLTPIARALANSPLPVPMPAVTLQGASPAAHRRAACRAPLYAAHLARWARRTLVPAFCSITPSGAPLPLGTETLDVLRRELQDAV